MISRSYLPFILAVSIGWPSAPTALQERHQADVEGDAPVERSQEKGEDARSSTENRKKKGDEARTPDPQRTRYLYSPSAMMLKRGEGYFSQKMLLFSAVGYGVTDHISVLAAGVVPLWFAGKSRFNFIVGAKVGGSLRDNIHLAAGAETLLVPQLGLVGFGFGTFTLGRQAAHLSLSAGKPFLFSRDAQAVGNLLVTLSGNVRVSPHVALISENWLMPSWGNSSSFMANAVAARLISERIAVDLGGVWVASDGEYLTSVPVPWAGFTYRFN